MNRSAINEMSQQEKLRAMEALWDSLSRDGGELASPVWHGEVLAARRAKIDSGTARFVSLDELKNEPRG